MDTVRVDPLIEEALRYYVEEGTATGGFLNAVLSGDLFGAVTRADLANRRALVDIVQYVWNVVPDGAYGSPAKVAWWIKTGGKRGRLAAQVTLPGLAVRLAKKAATLCE